MYRVIKEFADLQDGKRIYHVGDEFPRSGATVDDVRINQLLSGANALHTALIEKVNEKKAEVKVEESPKAVKMDEVKEDKPVKKRKTKSAE